MDVRDRGGLQKDARANSGRSRLVERQGPLGHCRTVYCHNCASTRDEPSPVSYCKYPSMQTELVRRCTWNQLHVLCEERVEGRGATDEADAPTRVRRRSWLPPRGVRRGGSGGSWSYSWVEQMDAMDLALFLGPHVLCHACISAMGMFTRAHAFPLARSAAGKSTQ